MPPPDLRYTPGKIPEGYSAIPLTADQRSAPIRICALVCSEPDPAGGALVRLRSQVDARVYLGCLCDAGGHVHEWVELWVQDLEGFSESLPAVRDALSNSAMDQRWREQVKAFERFERPVIIRTGWETSRPPVTFLDAGKREPVHPVDRESGDRWTLCEDDEILRKKGLAPFSSTLHRYLFLPKLGTDSVFVPLTAGAPTAACTQTLLEVHAGRAGLIPFNVGSGFVMVRTLGPVGLPAFLDMLGGGTWTGIPHGRSTVDTGLSAGLSGNVGGTARLTQSDFEGGLFLGQQGKWGRLVETFHLKVRALADAVSAVRAVTESAQRPLLNVSADSFQVRIGEPARGLPHLWSAKVTLADPGDAIALPIKASDAQYYVSPSAALLTVYRPAHAGRPTRGSATIRIREILPSTGDETILDGTLVTEEKISASPNDLAWIRIAPGGGRVDLHARLESQSAMAGGEWRFRTIPQRLSGDDAKLLHAAKGVPLPGSAFEIVPLLSTPVDLYALGVLAVRILLTDTRNSLPVAMDEVLSLAKQVASEHDPSVSLDDRIGAIFGRDHRWLASLGPHRLCSLPMEPHEAFDLIPSSLWWETLALIIRMFPGIGPDSECTDFGDARFGGVHLVFDRAVSDLEHVLRKTRSLIVIDWNYNREIHAVIRGYQAGLGGGSGGAGGAGAPTKKP